MIEKVDLLVVADALWAKLLGLMAVVAASLAASGELSDTWTTVAITLAGVFGAGVAPTARRAAIERGKVADEPSQ